MHYKYCSDKKYEPCKRPGDWEFLSLSPWKITRLTSTSLEIYNKNFTGVERKVAR
jgi:hypothetical protein